MANISLNPTEFLKRASRVALHYGFLPIEHLEKRGPANKVIEKIVGAAPRKPSESELVTCIDACIAKSFKSNSEPLLVFSTNASKATKAGKPLVFGLAIIGSPKTSAEALILKTTLSIYEEIGEKAPCVHVNSIGDRDSATRYSKELSTYFRKNLEELPAAIQHHARNDVFSALEHVCRKRHALREGVPHSMEYLTEPSRKHFREVLEYLERQSIPYEIDRHVVGHRDYYSHTLFEIRNAVEDCSAENALLARGGRMDEFTKKFYKTDIPTVGVMLSTTPTGASSEAFTVPKPRAPKVCFVQLGFEAKVKSLSVLETLRKARVPLCHALDRDDLSGQLALADRYKTPYMIIMGRKEALENNVIVRNVDTRSQDTVSLTILADYMKKLELA